MLISNAIRTRSNQVEIYIEETGPVDTTNSVIVRIIPSESYINATNLYTVIEYTYRRNSSLQLKKLDLDNVHF